MSPDVRLAEIVAALEATEAVRRQYRLAAQAADRADKETVVKAYHA
jgi:hypothetical protein